MILFFADPHLGHKMYHTLTEENITTAELDSRIALEKIYDRASQPDIDMIICAGDFFHSPKPSTENIRWAILWFEKMDRLGKPFCVVPGNHDVGALSSSLAFLYSLDLKNTQIIEWEGMLGTWSGWNLHFVPFLTATTLKNKYTDTLQLFADTVHDMRAGENNIIITHLQESQSTLGAERLMFAKAVEIIDLMNYSTSGKTVFLSGHMHSHQVYTKANGVVVVYPGSTTFMESLDCGERKGYILIDPAGNIKFEPIIGIRIFKKYVLPKGKDAVDFFSSIRMLPNEVVFLDVAAGDVVAEGPLRQLLKERDSILGKISYIATRTREDGTAIKIELSENNPLLHLENYLAQYKYKTEPYDWKNIILPLGKETINALTKNRG